MFTTTMIDPPWPEIGGGHYKRGADRHYKVLDRPGCRTCPEILSVITSCPVWSPAADGHLWLWVTDNFLPAGLWLIEQLGFKYQRTFQWVKVKKPTVHKNGQVGTVALDDLDSVLKAGIGQYGRGCHEMMLFATRGRGFSAKTDRKDIKSVFFAPHETDPATGKIVHSAKPTASYELIEARSKGPYAELFSRRGRPGWVGWGDEYKD